VTATATPLRDAAPPVTPARILDLSWGIARTGALTAALDLDVFSHVAAGARTAADVAARCGADPSATATLLGCLASLGLLEPNDETPPAYDLAPDTAAFLVRGGPAYLGDLRHMHHAINFRLWPRLAETVREGAAAADLFGEDGSAVWTKVTPYLDQLANANAAWLTRRLTLPAHARVLDVGCGSGAYSRLLAATSPDVRVVAIDREEVAETARRRAADAGLEEQVEVRGGDLRAVDWSTDYDLVLFSNLLHGYDEASSIALLERARRVLRPGGQIAILEIVPDTERPLDNPVAAFFSLQLLMTSGGAAHTLGSYRAQLRAAKLTDPVVTRCPAGPSTLLTTMAAADPEGRTLR
jgi:SAM-dependent methyltransferase